MKPFVSAAWITLLLLAGCNAVSGPLAQMPMTAAPENGGQVASQPASPGDDDDQSAAAPRVIGYLFIPEAPGEASEAAHADWIPLYDMSVQVTASPPAGGGGGPTSRPMFGPVELTARLDKSAPALLLLAAQVRVLRTVNIELVDPDSGLAFETTTLTNDVILKAQISGDNRTMQLTISYEIINLVHRALDSAGQPVGDPTVFCFNVPQNQRCP